MFGLFSRYFSLIWLMAVSKCLLNDVLYMFYMGSQPSAQVNMNYVTTKCRTLGTVLGLWSDTPSRQLDGSAVHASVASVQACQIVICKDIRLSCDVVRLTCYVARLVLNIQERAINYFKRYKFEKLHDLHTATTKLNPQL